MRTKQTITIAGLCLTLLIAGCGGGGGGSTNIVTTPSEIVAFMSQSLGTRGVYMTQNKALTTGRTLAIDVKALDLSNVYGTGFDIDFDSSKISYAGHEAGTYLESDGKAVTYIIAPQSGNSNKLIVGISRTGAVGGISGSGTIVTVKFNVTGKGNSQVNFTNPYLRDPGNQTITGVSWNGGTATIY